MERMTAAQYRDLVAGITPPPQRGTKRKRHAKAPSLFETAYAKHPLASILSPTAIVRLSLHEEERLAIDFATKLRYGVVEGRLSAVFCHVPNEIAGQRNSRTAQIRYAIAKAMGLIEGSSDYLFLWDGGCGALEAKTHTGDQSKKQVVFEKWCSMMQVPYRVFRSVDEGISILSEWGVWKGAPSSNPIQ